MNYIEINRLAASVATGNHKSFKTLYDLYYLKVYHFVNYFLPGSYDCEIAVSNIFCILWEKRRLLEDIENMDAYLYRISRHEAFHYIKKEKDGTLVPFEEMLGYIPLGVNSVEDVINENEMMQVYRLAVEALPERCREIFLRVREEKMSHREVSAIMGITPGTIEIQMNIAIKKISRVVKSYYPKLI